MKCLVFGVGNYYENRKQYIKESIIAFVDNYKVGTKDGVPIINPKEINLYEYDYLYIMSNKFIEIAYQLLDIGIDCNKILFGANMSFCNGFENNFISPENGQIIITSEKKLAYKFKGLIIAFHTFDELYNIRDIFSCDVNVYNYNLSGDNQHVVIDIGMNIGAATIYFANSEKVNKIYAYEPFKKTFDVAKYNFYKNSRLTNKIICKNAGLGIKKEYRELEYSPNMTCGLATDKINMNMALDMYRKMNLFEDFTLIKETVQILSVSEEVKEIFENHSGDSFILKIDCEGAELEILNALNQTKVLQKFKIILLEWHYNNKKPIEKILADCGFTFFSLGKSDKLGLIYGVNYEK